MATPVYGKQFIRFAETGYVKETDSFEQFTVVGVDSSAGTEPPTLALLTASGEAFGVVQQDVDLVDPEKATTGQRLATVATSGLLLVQAGATTPAQGTALTVDAEGKAISGAGFDVTVNSTTPQVRQVVAIGGITHVLVSFS